MFWERYRYVCSSSGTWRCVTVQALADVSEKNDTIICMGRNSQKARILKFYANDFIPSRVSM
jgi:hypothetical protein